jgi:hypothetical protein
MVPALLTLPLTEALLLMTMPVSVGLPKKPMALMAPPAALVTLPLTVEF